MKTIADFKRDIENKNLKLKMISRFGKEPKQAEAREIIKIQTNAIVLKTNNGSGQSWLDIPKASLCEYTGETLTIFEAGERELNDTETKILKDWNIIANSDENKAQSERDMLSDGSTMFWKQNSYFIGNDMEYMLGHKKIRGLRYSYNSRKIQDDSIKGKIELKYEIVGI